MPRMKTPDDLAKILTRLRFKQVDHVVPDRSWWVSNNGRGSVEINISEGGRWLIVYEEVRNKGFGIC